MLRSVVPTAGDVAPRTVTVLAAGTCALGALLLAPPSALAAAPEPCSQVVADPGSAPGGASASDAAASPPLARLGVDDVHRRFSTGAGVGVAVVDSGVGDRVGGLTSPEVEVVGGGPPTAHGSMVAGLVGGATGVAPDAEIHSVRIVGPGDLAPEQSASSEERFEPADLVRGLAWVRDNARRLGIGVVNLSLTTGPSDALARVVAQVQEQDVVVVAAVGNRTEDDEGAGDEDAAMRPPVADPPAYPAAYDGVLGVSAWLDADARERLGGAERFVLRSPATDVVAPVLGGLTVTPSGATCAIDTVATSWATAYVAGVVALVRSRFADADADEVVDRVERTATGAVQPRAALTGAGVVQPLDAVTRVLPVGPAESTAPVSPAPVAVPPEVAGAPVRATTLWWGLAGGAVLLGACVLRPWLRHRATTPGRSGGG